MGGFFDSRKFLRTPGFAQDGLYDRELPDRIVKPGEDPNAIWGAQNAETEPIAPVKELPSPQQPLPPRERIKLPDAPLPPKVGKLRTILGTAAELYLPQVGQEIRQPGYDRAQREYRNKVDKLQNEAKLNAAAALEDSNRARTSAEMARAEAQAALKRRTEAQMASDGGFDLGPGHARFNRGGGSPIATNPIPPKPAAPGVKMGRDGRPYFAAGEQFVELPPAVAGAVANTAPRATGEYNTLKQSIRDAHPDWQDHQVDAEAAKKHQEKLNADLDVKKHQANRPYGKTGTLSPTAQAAETRRSVADLAAEQVSKGGSVDQAIKNMNAWPERDEIAEKVLLHLHGLKAKEIQKPGKKASGLRSLKSDAPPAPKPPAPSGPPTVGTVKGGYRFKGGDPASPSSWEKM